MTHWFECDRCHERSKNRKEFFVVTTAGKKILYDDKPRFKHFDFCRTCYDEFEKWVGRK